MSRYLSPKMAELIRLKTKRARQYRQVPLLFRGNRSAFMLSMANMTCGHTVARARADARGGNGRVPQELAAGSNNFRAAASRGETEVPAQGPQCSQASQIVSVDRWASVQGGAGFPR
jgi:hypothetical protein